MPPRAPIGDRARIEAELSVEGRAFLAELCRLYGIPRRQWQGDDALNRLFTWAAMLSRAEAAEDAGASRRAALREAAAFVGLDPDNVEREMRRRRRSRADVSSSAGLAAPQ